jgi:nucleoid DNA-binding protein
MNKSQMINMIYDNIYDDYDQKPIPKKDIKTVINEFIDVIRNLPVYEPVKLSGLGQFEWVEEAKKNKLTFTAGK